MCREATDIFTQLGLFLQETSEFTFLQVLGKCLPWLRSSWAASGVVVLTWEFHHVRAFPCRVYVANVDYLACYYTYTVAYAVNRLHLFKPLSESNNSLCALEVQGLAF
ncbi:hypothetical protein Tco_0583172 [Tanacetum coccineum]